MISVDVRAYEMLVVNQCVIVAIAAATVLLAESGDDVALAEVGTVLVGYFNPERSVIAPEVKTA